jgi:hypothetical protein
MALLAIDMYKQIKLRKIPFSLLDSDEEWNGLIKFGNIKIFVNRNHRCSRYCTCKIRVEKDRHRAANRLILSKSGINF